MQEFISQQQLSDAEAEMQRLTLLAKLIELQVKMLPIKTLVSTDEHDVITSTILKLEESGWKLEKVSEKEEGSILETIKFLREKYGIDGLSETERLEIVKAIGLPKGHWYN